MSQSVAEGIFAILIYGFVFCVAWLFLCGAWKGHPLTNFGKRY